MKNPPRVFTIDVPVPIPVFERLCEHRERTGYRHDISEMTGAAITDWLAARANDRASGQPAPALNGYQWKRLFLPDGTILRTVFRGQNYHATVQGDRILFKDTPVSPSEFVNAVGCSGRNAWQTVWLHFPHDPQWTLAADCRERVGRRGRHAKLAGAQQGELK